MLGHRTVNCARKGCFAIVTLHPDDERRLRRTHEEFFCPAGHSNYFPDKTEEEKTIERLERHLENAEQWAQDEYDRAARLRALAVAIQVCPFGCGWHGRRRLAWDPEKPEMARFTDAVYTDLRRHIEAEHGARVERPEEAVA